MKLLVNQLVEYRFVDEPLKRERLRLLWRDDTGLYLALIDVDDKGSLPILLEAIEIESALLDGRARVLIEDPFESSIAQAREAARLKPAYTQKRDRAWSIIHTLVSDNSGRIYRSNWRGKMIRDVVARTGSTKKAIYGYLRRFWQGGHKDALLPNYYKRGGKRSVASSRGIKRGRPSLQSRIYGIPTGMNIGPEAKEKILAGLTKFYEREKLSFKRSYEKTIEKHFPEEHLQPTLGQARYWYAKERSILERMRGRLGDHFELKYRSLKGISTDIAGEVGALYQIDASIGDIYLVSSIDRERIVGRPVIYVVVDVFSRLVVGFYVGLEGPSWIGAALALEHAFLDKTRFLERYGLLEQRQDWAGIGLPKAILADRGELLSDHGNNLVERLNISIVNTPPYRPDWKGIVERKFRLINDEVIAWLPGAIRQLPGERKRGELEDAMLDIHQLREIIARLFHLYNTQHVINDYPLTKNMLEANVRPIPVNIWRWGKMNQSGKLHFMSPDTVRTNLLPSKEASVTRDGILLRRLPLENRGNKGDVEVIYDQTSPIPA